MAFLDIAPFTEAHTLVIPKKHYRWVWDVENVGGYFLVVKKIVNHYQTVTGSDFVSSIVWGQMVPHAHVQILPGPHKLSLPWERGSLGKDKGGLLVKKFSLR